MNIAIIKCEDHYEIEDENKNFLCSCDLDELGSILSSLSKKDKITYLQNSNDVL